ncbi:MAG: cytochrome c [Acidobacteriaceae bacterium]|nr:cytochrome c [Acidobacteriaceae bacterium]
MANHQSFGRDSNRGGGTGKLLLGFLLGIVFVAGAAAAYLRWGSLPVATADKPFPYEKAIVSVPLKARIGSQMQTAPFGVGEDVYEGGAHVYRTQCASCHGTPGHDVAFAKQMYPAAPQLWKKHTHHNVTGIGVSDDEPGETYWKVANGIRLTGMPAYNHVLSDTQMWQVTLLLKNADQPLPDPVMHILTTP